MMLAARPALMAALASAGFDIPAAAQSKDVTVLRRFLRAMVHIGLAPCLDAGAPPEALAAQLGEALHNEVAERDEKIKGDVAEATTDATPLAFPNKGSLMLN
jgi:hypothetical protein